MQFPSRPTHRRSCRVFPLLALLLAIGAVSPPAFAEGGVAPDAPIQGRYWIARNSASGIATDKSVARQSFPRDFKLFDLNIAPLRQALSDVTDNRVSHSTVIVLPSADGGYEEFEVFEASNFEPDLQVQFPEIRAFSGRGVTDKLATLKLSLSPQGIQTMLFRAGKESEFIEPYSNDHTVYAVFRRHREPGGLPWTCSTEDSKFAADAEAEISRVDRPESSAGQLKTMRLAQSCNGEYSNYFGATSAAQVALVLAAFNATLTRCNGVYEKDLALHLNLIAATTNVIYYNPATDPYSTLGNWNSELQATLNANIGAANYDIGHMFGASGGGGSAGCIGCVCVDSNKGSGITSPADGIPQGDTFDIDYVVHEVGHQLGGNHTFSHSLEGSGVNKEVGSGITIMGYAGITSYDVAPNSIDIFHETTIAQIQANLATKSCPVTTNITANNATPVVAALASYTIPISTPFELTGSATDANGDPLTYCWEQNDNSTVSGANSVASPTKASGPNWLSFSPTASPTRVFPKLSTIQSGLLVTPPLPSGDAVANIEACSSVSRTLNFRLTVRDNHPFSSTAPVAVGQTNFQDMTVTVSNTSGPFKVTYPDTAVGTISGLRTVTWNVASTTAAPVSAANVDIFLSTDSGATWPTTLAAGTPNDGTHAVLLPNITTSTARVKVKGAGNIFLDISDQNFSIVPGCGATAAAPTAPGASASAGNQITVSWTDSATTSITRYYVLRATVAGGPYAQIATVTDTSPGAGGSGTYNYNDTTVSGGITYYYVVQANDGAACTSANSGEVNVVATGTCTLAPSFAGAASASNNGTATCGITINWAAGTKTCAGASNTLTYNIYRSTASGTLGPSIASGVLGTTYSDSSSLTNGATYYYTVRAVDSLGNEDTNGVQQSAAPAGPVTTSTLTDTFEGALSGGGFDLAGWTKVVGSGANAWAWSTVQSQTPTHSWFAPDTSAVSDVMLVSPSFGVIGTTTLSFWHTYAFESATTCYDAGTLEVSSDGGTLWTVVPDAAFTAGLFNGTVNSSFGNPIMGKRAWCNGTVGPMTLVSVNLGGTYNGQTLKLRWHEGNDSSAQVTGWYVDSFTVTNAGTASACSPCAAAPAMSVNRGSKASSNVVQTWLAVPGAATYNVYRETNANVATWSSPAVAIGLTGVTWTDTNQLSNAVSRFYSVTDVNSCGAESPK